MNPFDSFAQVLFSPRRFYSRPHRYEEGLFWAGMGVVTGCLMTADQGPPPVWTMLVLASLVTGLSVILFLIARFCGGVGDFETAFSGAALACIGTLGPLALLAQAAARQSAFDAEFGVALAVVAALAVLWLLVMLFQNLWLLHALPWWRCLIVLALFVLACIPIYGGLVWLLMGLVLGLGLLMTARRPG